MKKHFKVATSLLLVFSMVMSLSSCVSTDVKTAGKEIMDNLFDGKTEKVLKAMDKKDDDFEAQTYAFELFFEDYDEDLLDFLYDDDVVFSKEKVSVKDDEGTISYVLEIAGEEYDFELNLVNSGKTWKIENNADFIVSVFDLIYTVGEEEGSKDFDAMANWYKSVTGASKVSKLGSATYDYLIDEYEGFTDVSEVIVEPTETEETIVETEPTETEPTETTNPVLPNIPVRSDDIVDFTMFIAMPGREIDYDNDIRDIIGEKTGVRVEETWLTGMTAQDAVGTIIASGMLPDYIAGGDGMMMLYEADCLVAWDDYLEIYPNLKELYTDEEWDMFRQDDGHIYWANVFCNTYGESKETGHNDEAFWIQARVLEWAGYPEIETLDEYFDLLERYADANPTMPDGTPVIPYTALCDDWRYFCIENAPQFLDGYPNDGSVIVNVDDPNKPYIVDYNTTETAKKYFEKLNEEYLAGYMDPDFANQTYDEYIAKLCTGCVLGMCDQYWDFAYTIASPFAQQGLDDLGCDYVPLGLVMEKGTTQKWHNYSDTINADWGVAVTTSCMDPDLAFQFLNDLLDQEIHDLRFWGVEGVDYLVDADGLFYRTEEMRTNWNDYDYQYSHCCFYSYMPQWLGTSRDGLNAMQSQEQASEFLATLSEPLANCFEAYGAGGYADMVGSDKNYTNYSWYPMYSYSNMLMSDTPAGVAFQKMTECKHKWLPTIVMAPDFDSAWDDYMDAYEDCKPQDFLDDMQDELERRMAEG